MLNNLHLASSCTWLSILGRGYASNSVKRFMVRIFDYHSAFMPFILCYQHLSTPWAFRMFYNPLSLFIESGVFSIESPGGSGNWSKFRIQELKDTRWFNICSDYAALLLVANSDQLTRTSGNKVVERCIFKKSRPKITSAKRLSTTPNSRL